MRAEELGDLQHRHALVRHGVAGHRVRKSNLHCFILFQVGLKRRSELHSVSSTVRGYSSSAATSFTASQFCAIVTIAAEPRQQIFFGVRILHLDGAAVQVEEQTATHVGFRIKNGAQVECIRSSTRHFAIFLLVATPVSFHKCQKNKN